jgi:hypothetical protein
MPNYLTQPTMANIPKSYLQGVQARQAIDTGRENLLAKTAERSQMEAFKLELSPIGEAHQAGDMAKVKQLTGQLYTKYPDLTDRISAIQKGMTPDQLTKAQMAAKTYAPFYAAEAEGGGGGMFLPEYDPVTGKATAVPVTMPEGMIPAKETPEQERLGKVRAAGETEEAKVGGKTRGQRISDTIDIGLDAARGAPVIKRAIEILNTVDTGGIDKASLMAKQFMGIETADEAELSNLLGKAVLSQLRATFGAQFTESEGERLNRIEAGLGKSPAGNKRILEQLQNMLEYKARRAIKAAEDSDDEFTAGEIRSSLEYQLPSYGLRQEAPAPAVAPAPATVAPPTINTDAEFNALPSGAEYTDPDDGKTYRKP